MTRPRCALVTRSKWLSRHLRHSPQGIGLDLEPGGWVRADDLLAAATMHADGFEFFVSDDGVWLCSAVPPSYLSIDV